MKRNVLIKINQIGCIFLTVKFYLVHVFPKKEKNSKSSQERRQLEKEKIQQLSDNCFIT